VSRKGKTAAASYRSVTALFSARQSFSARCAMLAHFPSLASSASTTEILVNFPPDVGDKLFYDL
jgi:hypothetical protein